MRPYYADDRVTLWHGDCLEVTDWLTADVLVTDPPYGRSWRPINMRRETGNQRPAHPVPQGIAGDRDTSVRDAALTAWGTDRLAIVFGDLMLPPPARTRQVLVYRKALDTGNYGATGGWRRDLEAVYLMGKWPCAIGGRSSLVTTDCRLQGGRIGPAGRYRHPHAKPGDVMETLILTCPPGVVADPFAGSGSTLVAARNLGRRAVGVEIDERYCEVAARRLSQTCLDLEVESPDAAGS